MPNLLTIIKLGQKNLIAFVRIANGVIFIADSEEYKLQHLHLAGLSNVVLCCLASPWESAGLQIYWKLLKWAVKIC